jgi:hypothetical protein
MISGDVFKRKLSDWSAPLSDKKDLQSCLRSIARSAASSGAISGRGVAWLTFRLLTGGRGGSGVLSGVLFTIPLVGPAVVIVGAAAVALLQTG